MVLMKLIAASTWGLAEEGVDRIKRQLSSDVEASTLSYQAEDAHLLTIEGETIESSLSEIGAIYAQFIEQHRPNFLNESSFIFPLETPTESATDVAVSEPASSRDHVDDSCSSLATSPSSCELPIFQYWEPSRGGLGCLGHISKAIIEEVAYRSKTELIFDQNNRIRVSGTISGIDSALQKLTKLDRSLVMLSNPAVFHMTQDDPEDRDRNVKHDESPHSRTFNWIVTQTEMKPVKPGRKVRKVKRQVESDKVYLAAGKAGHNKETSHPATFREGSSYDAKPDEFFEFLQPCLEAARSFPGPLTFEIHIGRLSLSCLPGRSEWDDMAGEPCVNMSSSNSVPPRTNVQPLPSKFSGRITTLRAALEQILMFRKANPEEGFIFDQKPSQEVLIHEFRFLTKDEQAVVVTIDAEKNVQVKHSMKVLTTVHVQFQKATWDASGKLEGAIYQAKGVDASLDAAIELFKESIVIPREQSLTSLTFRTIRDGELRPIEILVKKSAHHRYLSEGSGAVTFTTDNAQRKDIFLKITEVQSLHIQPHPEDKAVTWAFSDPPHVAAKKGRLWFEATMMSSSVREALLSNANLEAGETTNAWSTIDPNERGAPSNITFSDEKCTPLPRLITRGDITEMYRVTRILIEKMEALEQLHLPDATETIPPSTDALVRVPSKPSTRPMTTHGQKAAVTARNLKGDGPPRDGFDGNAEFW